MRLVMAALTKLLTKCQLGPLPSLGISLSDFMVGEIISQFQKEIVHLL